MSIFEAGNDGAWEIGSHAFTASTRDGGLSRIVSVIDGREVEVWNPSPSPVADGSGQDQDQDQARSQDQGEGELLAQCHCGGVSMKISRPRDAFISSSRSQEWIPPADPTRWLALLDLCSDCRLVTGTHLVGWLFVPRDHISPSLPDNLIIGTAKSYQSSADVLRTFCGTCGATVLVHPASQGDVVDIATGIIRCPEGVMLGSWAWWRSVEGGFPEDGLRYDRGFAKGLIEGFNSSKS